MQFSTAALLTVTLAAEALAYPSSANPWKAPGPNDRMCPKSIRPLWQGA